MAETSDKIEVENINTPGRVTRVDKAKYMAMKKAMLKVLPKKAPGLTFSEAREQLLPHLDQDLFPGGAKSSWWFKSVQLDLEAKAVIKRADTKPLRFYRLKRSRSLPSFR